MKIAIINGANLNMIGIRELEIYGNVSYKDLCDQLLKHCQDKNIECELYQSNHEGDLVDKIQQCYKNADGIVINPGAYTHTSIAILDALKAVNLPTVEVHISDINTREDFRKINYIKAACCKSFVGLGLKGYFEAVDYLESIL